MPGAEQSNTECQIHRSLHQGGDREQQSKGGLEVCCHGVGQAVSLDILCGSDR